MKTFELWLGLAFKGTVFLSENAVSKLFFYKSVTILKQNWFNVFPIFNPDNVACNIETAFIMKVNVDLLANEKFSGEFSWEIRPSIISNGANDHGKFNFWNFLSFQGHNFIDVPLNDINDHANKIVFCINET